MPAFVKADFESFFFLRTQVFFTNPKFRIIPPSRTVKAYPNTVSSSQKNNTLLFFLARIEFKKTTTTIEEINFFCVITESNHLDLDGFGLALLIRFDVILICFNYFKHVLSAVVFHYLSAITDLSK